MNYAVQDRDRDSASPHHDAIEKWIMANADSYINTHYDETMRIEEIARIIKQVQSLGMPIPKALSGPTPKMKIEKILEHLIPGKNSSPVGFIDVLGKATSPYLSYNITSDPTLTAVTWEERLDGFCFEAKVTIPSLGELLRQLRMYQEHFNRKDFHSLTFVVVSPDTAHRDTIIGQGIEFWECPPISGLFTDDPKLF